MPMTGAATAWLDSTSRFSQSSAAAVSITPRLQRKRKLVKP